MFLEEAPKALYCLLTVLLTFVFLKIGTSRGSGTGVAMRKTVKVSNISGWDRMGKVPWEVKGCVRCPGTREKRAQEDREQSPTAETPAFPSYTQASVLPVSECPMSHLWSEWWVRSPPSFPAPSRPQNLSHFLSCPLCVHLLLWRLPGSWGDEFKRGHWKDRAWCWVLGRSGESLFSRISPPSNPVSLTVRPERNRKLFPSGLTSNAPLSQSEAKQQ